MPIIVPPISKSDQALTGTSAGDILESAGSSAVPVVATPGTDYSVPGADETITGVKTFTQPIVGDITGNASTATTAAALSGSIAEGQVTGLTAALASKADDTAVVHNIGDEEVGGKKTFADGIDVAGTINITVGVGSPGFTMASGTGGTAAVFNDGNLNVVAGELGPIARYRADTHITSSRNGGTEYHRADATGLHTSVPVHVGAAAAGSANAQHEVRGDSASRPLGAWYDQDNVLRALIGPQGRITTPGRDGPIVTHADAATIPLDLSASDFHVVNLGGNRTLTLTGTPPQSFKVKLVQDGTGGWNPTWWSGITWWTADGNKPTPSPGAGKGTYVQFVTTGSGAYDGFLVAGQA